MLAERRAHRAAPAGEAATWRDPQAAPPDQLRADRADQLDLAGLVDQQPAALGEQAARARPGPLSSAALESVSASSASRPSAVTPTRPVQAGSPVLGSRRWWAKPPSARRQMRVSTPGAGDAAGGHVEDRRRLAVDRVAGMDSEGIELGREAADPDVPAAVDDVARVAAQALGEQVGRQSLAAAAGVEADAGRAPDGARLVVDLDQPPVRLDARARRLALRREREGIREGDRLHAGARLGVPGGDDRAEQGRVDETAGPLGAPRGRP